MSFSAIVVSHANDTGLRKMLGNLIYQTRPPDEIIVLVSDPQDFARLVEDFPQVEFHLEQNRNDWGHDKRAKGLALATEEYLGFFNDDDSYARDYLEKMLAPGTDVAYCNWEGPGYSGAGSFSIGTSTSGNFIVRTDLADRAGYDSRVYHADGLFIEAVKTLSPSIAKVDETLYFWNTQ